MGEHKHINSAPFFVGLGFVDRACASGWLSALSGQDKANPTQKLSDLSGLSGLLSHTSGGSRYQVGGTSQYWKLKFDLRAKLECEIVGAVWPLIW